MKECLNYKIINLHIAADDRVIATLQHKNLGTNVSVSLPGQKSWNIGDEILLSVEKVKLFEEGELPGVIVPLANGSVCSGWCDQDDPDKLKCGDYLLVEVDGTQVYYAETADLAKLNAYQLRHELNNLIFCLQLASGSTGIKVSMVDIPKL